MRRIECFFKEIDQSIWWMRAVHGNWLSTLSRFVRVNIITPSWFDNIILVCGNYKGIDERIRELHITKEISIGDFVLTGGEIPALILIDSIVRIIPGVISNETSALTDSFQDNLLSPPIYTRPAKYKNMEVPKILLSGNQKEIDKWREEESLKRTKQRRPDLLT